MTEIQTIQLPDYLVILAYFAVIVVAGLTFGPRIRKAQDYFAAGSAMRVTRELLPTLRPLSEIATYAGEAIGELRHGADLVLNVAPNGCMVATMGEALTPAITHAAGEKVGRVQHLFSADGDVNEELLTLALLKSMGPERYYRTLAAHPRGTVGAFS